jgi:hypothetical protein
MSSPQQSSTDFNQFNSAGLVSRHGLSTSHGYQIENGSIASRHDSHASIQDGSPEQGAVAQDAPSAGSAPRPKPVAARLQLSPINLSLPIEERGEEVRRLAIEAFPQCDNWVTFYREILGVEGIVRKLFPSLENQSVWEECAAFAEIHTMLSALRSHDTGKGDTVETLRMITVRLPVSMHEALKKESEERELSINKLCITKLLHKMDSRFVPQEPGKRRGRKPGPQGKRADKAVATSPATSASAAS